MKTISERRHDAAVVALTTSIIRITSTLSPDYAPVAMLRRTVEKASYSMIVALLRVMSLLTNAVEKDTSTAETLRSNMASLLIEATTDTAAIMEILSVIRSMFYVVCNKQENRKHGDGSQSDRYRNRKRGGGRGRKRRVRRPAGGSLCFLGRKTS